MLHYSDQRVNKICAFYYQRKVREDKYLVLKNWTQFANDSRLFCLAATEISVNDSCIPFALHFEMANCPFNIGATPNIRSANLATNCMTILFLMPTVLPRFNDELSIGGLLQWQCSQHRATRINVFFFDTKHYSFRERRSRCRVVFDTSVPIGHIHTYIYRKFRVR